MKYLINSIVTGILFVVVVSGRFLWCADEPYQLRPRISFFEVHLEPGNANEEMFSVLTGFIGLADQYRVKLTLLFTPQWAEMILSDRNKLMLLHAWQQNGHEIGGHHHGPSVCPWDGYTDLEYNSQQFRNRQNRVPCPEAVRDQEKYLGNMQDYVSLLNRLNTIKTITMSDADIDWPAGVPYAAGGRRIEEAISQPKEVIFNGQQIYKISSVPLLPRKPLGRLTELITLDDLKKEYLSEEEGVFGVVAHEIDYKLTPKLYEKWFSFLNEQDATGKYRKTVSQIIEEWKGLSTSK